jgi:hypothetical protein
MTNDRKNKEWLDDYPSLKQVSKNNPFTAPAGYFEGLDQRVISGIKLDELKSNISVNCFSVPENYFEGLSNNIQSRIAVETILNTEETGFSVPENYFEGLSNNIQSRIAVETILNTEKADFTVPENYFEGLSNNIQSRIAVETILNAEKTGFTVPENYFEELNNRVKSRVFVEQALNNAEDTLTVPQGYFNELNTNILNKTINSRDSIKHKSAVIRMLSSPVFKYATAACLVLMVGTGIFLKQFESPAAIHERSYLHQQLAAVPVNVIQNYLDENVDANDTQHTVADEDLPVDDASLNAALQNYADKNQ